MGKIQKIKKWYKNSYLVEVKIAQTLSFKPGSIIAMDKGYIDYDLLYRINQNDSFFVSRQKSNMNYRTVDRRTVLKNKGLTSDNTIKITGSKKEAYPKSLRRIGYKDPETGKRYFFITNNFKLAAKTIADIYKERWQVELFFKWIKQNLRIKKFYGTSRNAVYTQIWIALTTMLLLAFLKYKAKLSWSLYELLSLLRLMLFEKKNIWKLFKPDKDYYTIGDQMLFNFSNL
ncbi:MAG: IS4 family transposase [Deltaproteobacteria bacterium]|nr:IS4 family transposase [Deltaproteobacteria bacterium]